MPSSISAEEVLKHDKKADLWTVVDGVVYDLTDFAPSHPGGLDVLLKHAGRDSTDAYNQVHAPSLIKTTLPESQHKGVLDKAILPDTWLPSAETATGTATTPPTPQKPPLASLLSFHDFEAAAERALPAKAWAFVSSAATDQHTKRRNGTAYAAIGLRPRVLVDVARVDTSAAMLGHRLRLPFFCCPTSLGRVVHPDGEKELARGCRAAGIAQVVSTSASFPLRDIVAALPPPPSSPPFPPPPLFFQLYMDRSRPRSAALLADAAALGTRGVFLTVDAPVAGKREADERITADESLASPMAGTRARNDARGGGLGRVLSAYVDPALTWANTVGWLREHLSAPTGAGAGAGDGADAAVGDGGQPVVLKGVQTAEDAVLALRAGVDAIVVSNHGGRSLDTAPASVLVLLELRRCCPEVFERMEVYVDGGVARGTDVFKALCLGAKAVGLGRGMLYALNYGAEGVERFVDILANELETTMRMCGVTSLHQCHPRLINTLAVDHLIPNVALLDDQLPGLSLTRPKSKL